jgi:hypothetical protein
MTSERSLAWRTSERSLKSEGRIRNMQAKQQPSFCHVSLILPNFLPTHVKTHKLLYVGLQTSCYKSVHKLSTSRVRTACSQLLEQAWWHYQTCYKVILTSLIQSWYNKNVTRLITQGCNNIVIPWLYRTCWNNLATSLIISTRLLRVVNSLFQTRWQLGTSSANTTCWQTCYTTRCEEQ